MKYSSSHRGVPAGSPIANAFVIVVGALVIGVSVVLGFVAFVILGSIIAVLAAVIGLRLWWFNRKLQRQARGAAEGSQTVRTSYIEGEYRIIEKGSEDSRDDRAT